MSVKERNILFGVLLYIQAIIFRAGVTFFKWRNISFGYKTLYVFIAENEFGASELHH